jgi:LmbE family N-acetylglucosaminyl deacetylase
MAATKRVLAIAAHPDDIEFCMAGTLLLLREAGWEPHYLNVASGNCGSATMNSGQTRKVRLGEARNAARVLGAVFHRPFLDDLEIFYSTSSLRRLTAIIREVQPTVILTHSPEDYMEDHMVVSRLAVTAAFARGMRNYPSQPRRPISMQGVTIYHGMPHGLTDSLGQPIRPGAFADTHSVHSTKRAALACHQSQKEWLDVSQGMDSYLHTMDAMSAAVGKLSKRFRHAEGWRRHSYLGFAAEDCDPLRTHLRNAWHVNPDYDRNGLGEAVRAK